MVPKRTEQKINVYITPHFHYDYCWCDPPDLMGVKSAKNIKEALVIMRKHPDYKYVIDSVMAVEYFKLNHPNLMDELKQRVQEKRIELIGGMVIAPDTILPNGESLIRQVLYGKQYFRENFGVDSKVGYLIDSFGQTLQLPQILKKADFEFFVFVRGARNRNLPQEFWWKAPDGSKILAHWMYATYTYISLPFTGTLLPPVFPFLPLPFTLNLIPQNFKVYEILKKIFPPIKYFVQKLNTLNAGVNLLGSDMSSGLPHTIKNRVKRATTNNVFILNGTDNIPPSTNILDIVKYFQEKKKWVNKYDIKIALPSDFLRAVKNSRDKFGVVENYEFSGFPDKFPGTFSNRVGLKQTIRRLENLFYETELLSALASIYGNRPYPKEEVKKAIWRVLCCDFHDGICGCHVDAVYNHLIKMLRLSELQLTRLHDNSFNTLLNQIDTSKIPKNVVPILVFNPVSAIRTELAKFTAPATTQNFVIKDEMGNLIPSQKDILSNSSNSYVFLAKDVPSLGYKLYNLEVLNKTDDIAKESPQKDQNFEIEYNCSNYLIKVENESFILTFENKKLTLIKDKKNDISIKATDYKINDLRILNDRSDSYLNGRAAKKTYTTFENKTEVIEQGPVRIVLKISAKLQCKNKMFLKPINEVVQYIVVYNHNSPRIDFITRIKNRTKNVRIQACFPVNVKNPKFHSEVPYGYVERDTTPKIGGSWGDFKKKFSHYDRVSPVINWMSATDDQTKQGFAILNYGLPEHEIGANKDYLYLTLLKSTGYVGTIFPGAVPMVLGPFYAIPKALEFGEHEFRYSIIFHRGKFEENMFSREAFQHNMPFRTEILPHQKGILANTDYFLKIEPSNLLITSIKASENNDKEIVIRLVETQNKNSRGTLTFNREIKRVSLVNLLEELIKDIPIIDAKKISFDAKTQEILTFLIKF